MPEQHLSPSSIRSLLAHLLAGAAGGTEQRWANMIEIVRLSLHSHPASNWSVVPAGTEAEQDAIWRAIEVVRAEHPYAAW